GTVYFLKKGLDDQWTTAGDAETAFFSGTTYEVTNEIANKYSTDKYVFKGYSTTYSNTGQYTTASAGQSISLGAGKSSLYLYYELEKYDLVLYQDIAGTKPYQTVSLPYGASLSSYASVKPAAQANDTFAGWSTEKNLSSYDAEKVVDWSNLIMTDALSIYPIWVHDKVQVTWNQGYGDSSSTNSGFVKLGETINTATQNATRDGYSLDGWYTQKGTKWDNSWDVTPEYCDKNSDGSDYIRTNSAEKYNYYTLTLTAHWNPETANVVYALGEHPASGAQPPASGSVAMGGTTILAAAPTPDNDYLFTGWKDSKGTLYSAGGSFTLSDWSLVSDKTVTLTAQYVSKPTVKVFFNTDGGIPIGPINQIEGTTIALSSYTTERTGYTFAHWSVDSTNYSADANYQVPSVGTDMVTLTANWTVNQYTLTFDSLGGSTVASITQNYSTDITAPAAPTREHYDFKGWYPALPSTMPAENLTLKAIWEPTKYTVSFKDDQTVVGTVTNIYGATVNAPADLTKSNFAFDGWRDSNSNAVTFPTYITGNLVFTAAWRPAISYDVTFKVANGQWNDGTATDKIVTLEGHEGDVLKLTDSQIPAVGNKPDSKYIVGDWAETPNKDTVVNEDTTYIYVYEAKAEASVTNAPEAFELVYSGTAQNLVTAGIASGGTMQYALGEDATTAPTNGWSTSISTAINAGTYYVWYKVIGDDNHNDATPACVTVTIAKTSSGKQPPTAKNLTYNGSAQELVTAGEADGGTMQYALGTDSTTAPTTGYSTSIPQATEVGTYYVWYKVFGDENHNDVAPACVTVTITENSSGGKTTPTVKAPTAKSLTYNGSAQELVDAGSTNGGTLQYALGTINSPTTEYSTSIPTAINAGTYYVWYRVVGNENYSDVAADYVIVTIYDDNVTTTATDLENMSPEEKQAIKTLTLTSLEDLTAIRYDYLTNLTTVKISETADVETVDLSKLPETVQTFSVSRNDYVKTLTLGGSTVKNIEAVSCDSLVSVDLAGNDYIVSLDVSGSTKLAALNASNCSNLRFINCSFCLISSFDVKACVNLISVDCSYNSLLKLDIDVTGLPALTDLNCVSQSLGGWKAVLVLDFNKFMGKPETANTTTEETASVSVANFSKVKNLKAYDKNNVEISTTNNGSGNITFASLPDRITYDYETGFNDKLMDVEVWAAASDSEISSSSGSCGVCNAMSSTGVGLRNILFLVAIELILKLKRR
ncbi:MAG: InlB B-repeat-containing protein, partial [Synergistaceae bacterium]|nr:InlB B-repeat-containing protein [Synergistaceae bacterium]